MGLNVIRPKRCSQRFSLNLTAAPPVGHQQRDCAGNHASSQAIGAARYDDRDPCAENQSRPLGIGQERQLLGQDVSRLQVGRDEYVGIAGSQEINQHAVLQIHTEARKP